MPKASTQEPQATVPDLAAPELEQFICPSCGVTTHYECRLCGATRTRNQVSGNIIWMRNGRVVRAFQDTLQAWVQMATQYQVPIEQWPDEYKPYFNVKSGDVDADF